MNDLSEIPYESHLQFVSFDISNMYMNIPTDQIPNILHQMCEHNNVDPAITTEVQ